MEISLPVHLLTVKSHGALWASIGLSEVPICFEDFSDDHVTLLKM